MKTQIISESFAFVTLLSFKSELTKVNLCFFRFFLKKSSCHDSISKNVMFIFYFPTLSFLFYLQAELDLEIAIYFFQLQSQRRPPSLDLQLVPKIHVPWS